MADNEKAKLYARVTKAPDWWVLERMRLHGFWPEGEGLPPDPPDEVAERKELENEIQDLRQQTITYAHPEDALQEERLRRIKESRERRQALKLEREQKAQARREAWQAYTRENVVYLGDEYSAGLDNCESAVAKLQENGLPILHRSKELAAAMGIELSKLRWLTYHRKGAAVVHYRRYDIQKKTGGVRNISAPRPELAQAQQWVKSHVLDLLKVSENAHGFVAARSVVSNAKPHVGSKVVVNMDMKDFFPTITFRRVKGMFCQVGYSEHLATTLALLCTEPPRVAVEANGKVYYVAIGERVLPQGACTSPAITNVICRRLDARLSGFANLSGFQYSRYADDLTFSGEHTGGVGRLLRLVRLVLKEEGFCENEAKTRIMRSGRRQEVTGVAVNQQLTIGRREYRRLRAILHNAAKHGLASQNRNDHPAFGEYLRGRVAFIRMINPEKADRLQPDLDRALQRG